MDLDRFDFRRRLSYYPVVHFTNEVDGEKYQSSKEAFGWKRDLKGTRQIGSGRGLKNSDLA